MLNGDLVSHLTISGSLEVHIRVSERAAREFVSTDSDGLNRTDRPEALEQHGFSHVRLQIANIQRAAHPHLHQIDKYQAMIDAELNAAEIQSTKRL